MPDNDLDRRVTRILTSVARNLFSGVRHWPRELRNQAIVDGSCTNWGRLCPRDTHSREDWHNCCCCRDLRRILPDPGLVSRSSFAHPFAALCRAISHFVPDAVGPCSVGSGGVFGLRTVRRTHRAALWAIFLLAFALWSFFSQTWAFMGRSRPDVAETAALQLGAAALFALITACGLVPVRRLAIVLGSRPAAQLCPGHWPVDSPA